MLASVTVDRGSVALCAYQAYTGLFMEGGVEVEEMRGTRVFRIFGVLYRGFFVFPYGFQFLENYG